MGDDLGKIVWRKYAAEDHFVHVFRSVSELRKKEKNPQLHKIDRYFQTNFNSLFYTITLF